MSTPDVFEPLEKEMRELRGQIVYRWDMDEIPTFREGVYIPHEMEERVTAEDCTCMVQKIVELRQRLSKYEQP